MFMPQSNDQNFAPPPSGTHIAVCYRVIDLGTQKQDWKGETKFYRKVMLSWEIPGEKMEDGRPFTISQRYTFSSSERARLRKDLESWRGRAFTEKDFGPGGFDIKNVLAVPCMLSIIHAEKEGKTYANISSVSALPKGVPAPTAVNDPIYFSLERERFDKSTLDGLSEGLQKTIKSSPEFADVIRKDQPSNDYPADRFEDDNGFDDSIPF